MPVANISATYGSRQSVLAAELAAHQERLRLRRVRYAATRELRARTGNPYATLPSIWTEPTVPELRTAPVPPPAPHRLTSRDTTIGLYHANSRERQVTGDRRELYGLEMEVQARDSQSRDFAVRVANADEAAHFVDAEQDGSLDSYSGVEFITRRPMTAADLFESNGWLDRFTSRITAAGIRQGRQPNGYGIHINVNCHGWSPLAKQAFCAAVNLGYTFHPAIAGRSTGGGHYGATHFTIHQRSPTGPYFFGWTQRGNLAYVRSNNTDCIEVRSFQGTTDPATIRAYIAHLQELRVFSQRYQSILLYMSIGTYTGYFTTTEAYAYVDMLRRETPSYSVAISRLPDTISTTVRGMQRTHNQLYSPSPSLGVVLNAVFNPSSPFRLRKAAMRSAWNTQEPVADNDDSDEDYIEGYDDESDENDDDGSW